MDLFERAVRSFDDHRYPVHAAMARYLHGKLIGGDAGAEAITDARAPFEAQGVRNVPCFVRMWAPTPEHHL